MASAWVALLARSDSKRSADVEYGPNNVNWLTDTMRRDRAVSCSSTKRATGEAPPDSIRLPYCPEPHPPSSDACPWSSAPWYYPGPRTAHQGGHRA